MQTRTIVDLLEGTLIDCEYRSKELKGYYPPGIYLKEFQTIKLSLPRGLGHTTAVLKLIAKYNTVMIVPKVYYSDHLIYSENFNDIVSEEIRKESIFTLDHPYQDHTKFNNLDFIIFDPMSGFDKTEGQRRQREEFMRAMQSRTKLFVELG